METQVEVQRLKAVYQGYAASGFARSKWSAANRGNQAMLREREAVLLDLLSAPHVLPLSQCRILDLGCGTGELLRRFQAWGARAPNLYGIDLLPERIQSARQAHPGIQFQVANAEALPWGSCFFDLVSVFTVFTSILNPGMAANAAREIHRVLAPGGSVIWYDFRWDNPLNPAVKGLSRKGIQQLFPGFRLDLRSISLAPPLARRLGPMTSLLYRPLASLPFLRSHLLGLLVKP